MSTKKPSCPTSFDLLDRVSINASSRDRPDPNDWRRLDVWCDSHPDASRIEIFLPKRIASRMTTDNAERFEVAIADFVDRVESIGKRGA